MKKVIFISALAIAAAVSCTKSDIVDTKFNEQIGFEAYIGRDAQTKASVVDASNIGTAGIYGFYTGANPWATTSKANLWVNDPLDCEEGTVEPAKFWTNENDQYSFLAYAPKDEDSIVVPEPNEEGNVVNPAITYTVDPSIPAQIDLTYAVVENITKAKVDVITGEGAGKVPMTFKHALARLTVNASKSTTEENFDFIVKKITITGGFITSDALTLKTGLWAKNGTPATVNATTPATTYTFYDVPTNKTQLTTTATKYAEHVMDGELPDNYLMMIPVNFASQKASVHVEYTTVYEGEESTTNEADFDVTTNFEQGKAYAINLVFSKKTETIEFYVTVDKWEEGTVGADGKNPQHQDKDIVDGE